MPKQTFFNLPEEKRAHILEVAVNEFAEKGYSQASISGIVAGAGIAKGSFYQYFEDKDDLYLYVISTMISERKLMIFEREKHRLADLNLTGYLRLVFRMQLETFQQEPQLIKVGMDLIKITGEPVHKKLMGRYQNNLNEFFLPFIRHEVEQGELDPRVNAQLLNYMLHGLSQYVMYRMQSGEFNFTLESIDSLVDDLDYILTHGIYFSGRGRA